MSSQKKRFKRIVFHGRINDYSNTTITTEFSVSAGFDKSSIGFGGLEFSSFGRQFHEITDTELGMWDNVRATSKAYFEKPIEGEGLRSE